MITLLRKMARPWAVVFILANLLNVLAPTISWALTSGPTAPEATSFEPVDTTDMVSLSTGDFTYNVPLLEVPGPAGGYPLSLSYHAGIQPNEDASWVGLGWTLNPGAITRLTNGLPDDFDGAATTNRVYWQGGETTTTTVGISIGIANVATVSAGLSFSQDTYRGFGVGGQIGASLGHKFSVGKATGSIGINATVGISPYGDVYSSLGIGISIGLSAGAISASASAGLSINSSGNVNAGLSGGVGLSSGSRNGDEKNESFGGSLLGASIGTGGGGGTLSAAGFTSSANNPKDGKISTSEDSWSVDIPVWYGINVNLGRSHIRYWMDETVALRNYGALNFPSNEQTNNANVVYDSYHVQGTESIKTGNNPEKYLEGSYADYDQYSVNAQGLVGNIRPHHYMLSLYSQDIIKESDGTKEILNYNIPQHSVGVQYRFVNDFSNKIINDPPDFEYNKTFEQTYWTEPTYNRQKEEWRARVQATQTITAPLFFPYGNPQTGLEGSDQKRYAPNVPGSKNVEYFTNQDIISYKNSLGTANVTPNLKPRGFIECNAKGFSRSSQVNGGQVGAFTITNQSGVNYHFSLPAYAYDEFTYSGSVDDHGKLSYNVVSQPGKYAYTWYLTGMTGPDYVDRGPTGSADNILNEYDWGYWVDFQYGKWTDNFQWRNPSDGFNQDVDHRFKSFSMGKKEVYYLNAIKTKTHTALFIKEIRADGKGVDDINYPVSGTTVNQGGKFTYWPKASLKLKRIMVFNNFDLSSLDIEHGYYDHYTPYFTDEDCIRIDDDYGGTYNCTQVEHESYVHYGHNVLDEGDLVSLGAKVNNSIRQVDFTSDYSLAPGTFNSFDPNGVIYPIRNASGPNLTPSYSIQKLGKLTLNSITFKGKGGLDFLPPTKFSYDLTNSEILSGSIGSVNSTDKTAYVSTPGSTTQFGIGDLVKFTQNSNQYYGYLTNSSSSGLTVKFISSLPLAGSISNFSKTKNPPYNKDFVDIWGMYKCDYKEIVGSHLTNYTSNLSSKNVDAWSLREIENSTGSITKISYESDTYNDIVLPTASLKIVSGRTITTTPNNYPGMCRTIEMEVDNLGAFDLTERYSVGSNAEVALSVDLATNDPHANSGNNCYSINAEVKQVSPNRMTIWGCIYYSGPGNQAGGCAGGSSCYYEVFFKTGKVYLNIGNRNVAGGGLRVKSLSLMDKSTGENRSTNYSYEFNGVSQGTTSYEQAPEYADANTGCFAYSGMGRVSKILSLSRDIPSPGIFYKKVRVGESIQHTNESIDIPGYSEYVFEVFSKDMIDYSNSNEGSLNTTGSHKLQQYQAINTRKVTLKDFTQRVGKLKSVTLYDKDGRRQNETINHYLHDEQSDQSFSSNTSEYENLLARFNKQGLVHETFNHARVVKRPIGTGYDLQGIISKKENYPAIQTGTTSINYKTGIKTESKTLAFDFYNGNVSKSLETDGYGNSFVTEINYAYNNYPAMGLKSEYLTTPNDYHVATINNKHMIDQQAGSTTYKVVNRTNLTPISIVSASAQTWSDQSDVVGVAGNNQVGTQAGIWRQKSSFNFIGGDQNVPLASNGDGLQPIASFAPFTNWATHAEQSGWRKNAEITKYDFNSHAIEAKDINDHFAATKFSYDHSQVLATAANSKYEELAYSSAEEPLQTDQFYNATSFNYKAVGGGVYVSGNATLSPTYHTGSNSVQANANQKAFMYFFKPTNGTTYQVNVWSSQANAQIKYRLDNGADQLASMLPAKTAGNWNQIVATIPVNGVFNKLEVWCEANGSTTLFDDFRFHPYQAAMTSYVYNNWGELTHILDNNNLYTEYRYDQMGRLEETYKESFQASYGNQGVVKVSELKMNYGILNPMMTSITATSAGATGSVSPVGNTSVILGKDVSFNFIEYCSGSFLQKIFIDNKQIPYYFSTPSNLTLYDGTEVSIIGKTVTFKKIKSPHTLRGEFYEYPNNGFVRCEVFINSNGTYCNTGRFVYGDLDPCGLEINVQLAASRSEIPAWLLPLAPDLCPPSTSLECNGLQN